MTVSRLVEILQEEVSKGNGHMPVGIALDGRGITTTAGLFGYVQIGVSEKYDTVWIVGKEQKEKI